MAAIKQLFGACECLNCKSHFLRYDNVCGTVNCYQWLNLYDVISFGYFRIATFVNLSWQLLIKMLLKSMPLW